MKTRVCEFDNLEESLLGGGSGCQQVKDTIFYRKQVGVAENPRSGVEAKGEQRQKAPHIRRRTFVFRNQRAPPP
jgi:hypothetical protein